MDPHESMEVVTKEYFYQFLLNKPLTRVQGETFHSAYYKDENGELIAYYESSSWSMNVIHKIKGGYVNGQTISLVGSIIRKKENR